MVFRVGPDAPMALTPQVSAPPRVCGFGIDREHYVLFTANENEALHWRLSANSTQTHAQVTSLSRVPTLNARTLIASDRWLIFEGPGEATGAVGAATEPQTVDAKLHHCQGFALWFDSAPCALIVKDRGEDAHRMVSVYEALSGKSLVEPWKVPHSARALLAACATVQGPVAIFETDREDEVDVCVLRATGLEHRTVSLGTGQRFVSAAGGGSRIAIISRKGNDVRLRTIASDLRSELNQAPLVVDVTSVVGEVHIAHGGGTVFVVAHTETRAHSELVVTVFDDGNIRRSQNKFAAAHGMAVSGNQFAIVALVGGVSAPVLHVQQFMLLRDDRRGETRPTSPRRRAYLLGNPSAMTQSARRGLLTDCSEVLAQNLSAQPPREVVFVSQDSQGDVIAFVVAGATPADDIAVSILLRPDGSAIANAKLGGVTAPTPRALTLLERLRVTFQGDDDNDPSTVRCDLASLAQDLGQLVTSIWATRVTR
ncbi:MAG: hypothetical protein Q8Q09_09345 [Deltaproteobacteria bacterium]|nr:hypothetical protein [Deltaproteobacteria bacterium]